MSKWKSVNIGNSGLFIADGNYSAKYPNSKEFISSGVPFIRANNFKNKTIVDDELYFISPEKHSQITKGHLKTNDVLITTRGNIGELAIVPKRHENSNINAQIVLLRCNDEWDPLFLLYILSSSIVKEQLPNLTTGTALKQLPVKNLKKIILPLPPLQQQQKIANILDAADALRQNDKELIAKYDELTQALFLDMFGDPVSNPKGWEKVELKKCTSKIGSGSTPRGGKENYLTEGIALIRSLNIYDNEFKYKNLAYISQEQADKLKNVIVESSDVLFNITGASVCRCSIVPDDVLPARVNQHVSILRPMKEKLSSYFLSHLLISENVKIKLLGVGSFGGAVMEAITKEQLEKIEVILPSIDLQNQFAERVAVIEEQKAIAQKSLEKSEELFNSLLQKAFKGELV